jgi:hypothetical protein
MNVTTSLAGQLAEKMIQDLSACLAFLIANGVGIISFGARRRGRVDVAVVTVAPTPAVYALFPDRAWREQAFDGVRTVYTWFAHRNGVRVEWEDARWH